MTTRVLMELEAHPRTVVDVAGRLDAREIIVRRCLSSLIDRVLVAASRKAPHLKQYGLTTLGQMEVERIQKAAAPTLANVWATPLQEASNA